VKGIKNIFKNARKAGECQVLLEVGFINVRK
jgi:hypothetical protein